MMTVARALPLIAALLLIASGCDDGSTSDPADTWTDTVVEDTLVADTLTEDTEAEDTVPVDTVEEEVVTGPCDPPAAPGTIYELEAFSYSRFETVHMCEYRGDVLLIANVAALCGYTPQMGDLATLQTDYHDQGFEVLGFYCNQFLNQAGNEDQREACETSYGVNFTTFEIINVNPPDEHLIFTWLKSQPGGAGAVSWNFEKWLIGRDGELLERWTTDTSPTSTDIRTAIEAALAE